MKNPVFVFAIVFAAVAVAQQSSRSKFRVQVYDSATVDDAWQLRILTTDGKEILPRKSRDQVGFSAPAVSPDKRTVGWLAEYPNTCCTSYPIPLGLVLYSGGKKTTVSGKLEMFSEWRFLSGGDQVGFRQETVHGGLGAHYELHEVRTGKLIAQYDPKTDADGQEADEESDRPDWVKAVDTAR